MKGAPPLLRAVRAASGLWVGALLGCSALQAPVARQVDGVQTEGRFIEPEAYGFYAAAALREARGQWTEALTLYQRAFDIDSHGPELRTRIGAVACRLHRDALADRAFAAANRADTQYGPLWFELARCRKSRGDVPGAERAALEAVRLDPERTEASLLAADLAEQRGDLSAAWRLRDALQTHAPDAPAVQRALLAAAERHQDVARTARAREALAALTARSGAPMPPRGTARALAALERGDLVAAKRDAETLFGADPSNGDALLLALVTADLAQAHETFDALLEQASDAITPASPELFSALSALLTRRVGAEAGQLVQP